MKTALKALLWTMKLLLKSVGYFTIYMTVFIAGLIVIVKAKEDMRRD